MALTKKADAPAAGAATVETKPGTFETETPGTPAQQAAAAEVAGTAIAKAQASAVVASGPMKAILSDLKDAVGAVDFGTLPRLTGSNGNVMDNDKKLLGEWVELTLISWNEQYVVSPGDDSAEAKALVRYSRDGKTIDETGESVNDYLEKLRTVEGYEKAKVKEYCELIGIVEETAKPSEHVNSMVQVSLSPESRKSFEGYRLQRSVQVKLGRASDAGSERLILTAEVKSNGPNSYTLLKTAAADSKKA